MGIKSNYEIWLGAIKDIDLINQLIKMTEAEMSDAFYKDLEFGTGGLRGIMGAGTNRLNFYTVGKATQGLCDVLKSRNALYCVAIAYDSRINSKQFAKEAAGVISANGGMAYVFSELMPTPILSYAVRELKCDAGIVITASHNPAKYNGYKVYGRDGCQITLQMAKEIQTSINKVEIFGGVTKEPFEKAVQEGRSRFIPTDIYESYLYHAQQCAINPEILRQSDIKVIYTPLNGTGNKPVREILKRAGLENLTIVPEQENPDGSFPTCKKPNPEEHISYELAIELAAIIPADIILATDPDCDRVGVAVKYGYEYRVLTGNETGCLLLDYILSQKKANNTLPSNPVIIKTIVTGAMADLIAKEYGARVIDTLTGFKYIGEQIGLLEQMHISADYVFGFEESFGYLPGVFVRDKDAVSTSLLICEMASYYKKANSSLPEELEKLYIKHGFWKHKLISFSFGGADGMEKMQGIMRYFRKNYFADYAGLSVVKTDDYLNSVTVNKETGINGDLLLPKSDVLLFTLEDNCEIVIRPSGTEPKLKCYLTAKAKDVGETIQRLNTLEADITDKIKMAERCE